MAEYLILRCVTATCRVLTFTCGVGAKKTCPACYGASDTEVSV